MTAKSVALELDASTRQTQRARLSDEKEVTQMLSDSRDDPSSPRFASALPKTIKAECVFFCQFAIIAIVVLSCIINLSINRENNNVDSSVWISLLSASIGYLLPAPSLKRLV